MRDFTSNSYALFILLISVSIAVTGCTDEQHPDPEMLVNKSIVAHGMDRIFGKEIQFKFRDREYRLYRDSLTYVYTRITGDSIEDVLHSTEGFSRFKYGKPIQLADSMAVKYSSSVNSVLYFFQLPLVLNDPAVRKEYLGTRIIKDSEYHSIKVTFAQESGGEDFEDEFRYWINTATKEIDYLAYSYLTDGGGIRFREAYNKRRLDGIMVQDYRNYKPPTLDISLDSLPGLFERNKLELLSIIENTHVEFIND